MKLNTIISLFIKNVMINDTIKKYEIKEKHKIYKIYVKPFWKKTTSKGENFTINLREITKYIKIGNKP